MSQESRDEATRFECLVAAILTTATVDSTSQTPVYVVNQYQRTLDALRRAGGPVNPSQLDR
jgi:hypothetical protein